MKYTQIRPSKTFEIESVWAYANGPVRYTRYNREHTDKGIWISEPDNPEGYSMANQWCGNIFHWYFDVAIDYFLLREYGATDDSLFYIADDFKNHAWCRETMDILALKRVKELGREEYYHDLHTARAVKVVYPQRRLGRVMDWAIPVWRQFMAQKVSPVAANRNLFITRRNGRNIENQCEILSLLGSIGLPCQVVQFEDMKILDQVKVVQEAKFIIGVHGAGLTNWTFCNPETKVVEIISPLFHNASYREIAHYNKLHYLGVLGEERSGNKDLYTHSIYVNPATLRWVIQEAK